MSISKSDARKLAMNGIELGAHVLRGVLSIKEGTVKIDEKDIGEWLKEYENLEIIFIAAPVGAKPLEKQLKTCYTCGRDYTGNTCTHCAEARARLRG